MRKSVVPAFVLISALLALPASASAATIRSEVADAAHAGPVVSLQGVVTKINIHKAATFRYTATHLAAHESVQLQRQFGTAGVWKRVKTLTTAKSAVVDAPKLPQLGRYIYRVAVVRYRQVVTTSRKVTVLAYANVALAPICGPGNCSGTEQVGNNLFTYTDEAPAGFYPDYAPSEVFDNGTSCRSLSVEFAGDGWAQSASSPQTDYLEFVQETLDPVYASVTSGNVGTVSVPLDGGPLNIDAAVTNDGGVHNNDVMLNITGSCYTQDGNR